MGNKNKVAVIITTYNEENNIRECVRSAKHLTDNIIVIDNTSTDQTVSIAQELKCKIIQYPYTVYVEPTRDFALQQTDAEWVFILDADERITPKLAVEVLNTITSTNKTHYKILRQNIFAKTKWLKHGGWYPDYIIRLIRKDAFLQWPKEIHSTPRIKGEMGYLKEPLVHEFHSSLESMVEKTIIFENVESNLLFKAKRKSGILIFLRKFLGELYRRFVKWGGFLDGTPGIIESLYQAYSKTITYLMLYEKTKRKSTTI